MRFSRLPDWLLHRSPQPIAAAFERRRWRREGYSTPLPAEAKRAVLRRHGGMPNLWIETGTYVGDTTAMLARLAGRVVSFEPAAFYFERATARFANAAHVTILNEPSEHGLADVLEGETGSVSLWLDGHYSGGLTYCGGAHCPLEAELAAIGSRLHHFHDVRVLIDDIRLCGVDPAYPTLDRLVDWSRMHAMSWHIEHDIFVAKKAAG